MQKLGGCRVSKLVWIVRFERAMGIGYPGGFAIRCITTLPTVLKLFKKSEQNTEIIFPIPLGLSVFQTIVWIVRFEPSRPFKATVLETAAFANTHLL